MRALKDKISTATTFVLNNKILFFVWLFVLVAILFSNDISLTKKIIGYVDNQKININFKEQVRVKKIIISAGNEAKKGDVVAILDDKELELLSRNKKQELDRVRLEIDALNEISYFNRSNKKVKETLEKRERLLADEVNNLNEKLENQIVTAPYDCIVSDVYFEEGEVVPALSPLLSIQTEMTNLVHAFINEHDNFPLKSGQEVLVENIHSTAKSKGKIIVMSNEYKEMPTRIATSNLTTSWGTRVTIKLEDSAFRRGEKVLIKSLNERDSSHFFINDARAEKSNKKNKAATMLQAPKEFSAIARLDDESFLVADDEGEKLGDGLFVFNQKTSHLAPIEVENDIEIEDIESIAKIDNQSFLIGASQSLTKKGKSKSPRFKVALLRRQLENKFEVAGQWKLRSELQRFLNGHYPDEKEIIEKELDVEAMQVHDGRIFFGMKNPRLGRKALVVEHNLEEFLKSGFLPEKAKLIKANLPNIGYELSSIKIISAEEVYASFVKDDQSWLYQTTLKFQNYQQKRHSEKKIEGVEKLSDDNFILAIDEGKQGGRIEKAGAQQ